MFSREAQMKKDGMKAGDTSGGIDVELLHA